MRWRIACSLLALGIGWGLPACSLEQPQRLAPPLQPAPTIRLPVTTEAVTLKCQPAQQASVRDVAFRRTFFDDFQQLDRSWTRWHPHYDGGWDPSRQRWQGYDWMVKRTLQGNKEQQLYVDPGYAGTGKVPLGLDPFRRVDGHLEITAQRTPPDLRSALAGYEFVSGLLTSRPSFTQKHGFFELRARIPAGKGLWPAFWLLPMDKSWPPEIDVFEVVGSEPEVIAQTTHWKDPQNGARRVSSCRTRLPGADTAFHQYGVLWTPERIVFYLDRLPVAHFQTPPGLDQPMYMLMNLAVGGTMVGPADADTPMPSALAIEWVAAYELEPPSR
jgi:beta-glucanase (GH16 family)